MTRIGIVIESACPYMRRHDAAPRAAVDRRRRGLMLLLVLMTLALAAALITPLATLSGIEAVTANYQADTLVHDFAIESLIAVLPEWLEHDRRLNPELERDNRTELALQVGRVQVVAVLSDDSAKLPLPLLLETAGPDGALTALAYLRDAAGLPALDLQSPAPNASENDSGRLRWTGCFEDLFSNPRDAAVYGAADTNPCWSEWISPFGNAVRYDRATPEVLEALLRDVRPGLGTKLSHEITHRRSASLTDLLADFELTDQVFREVSRRLTTTTQRYSLTVRTTLGRDTRQHYLICSAAPECRILLNWEVAP